VEVLNIPEIYFIPEKCWIHSSIPLSKALFTAEFTLKPGKILLMEAQPASKNSLSNTESLAPSAW